MTDQPISSRNFVDGTMRPIYVDERGQYVLDDDGERVYGLWLAVPPATGVALPWILRLPSG